ncbi:DUF1818 family protein [Crocosphaera chwakensis]|uniref:DUF1818 domain-containing protein n=1 Tax=Crocosphaera chwakensis CCY0110 TaxID=391612 RepID=A3IVF1_9CHRO|nr:DUF1818 family protein [Crocosphaera chwakensis]EAZ89523.1 hypothetical protein CY0110_09141 [Crocosphaera chwakensis CCY0110]
MSDRIIKKGQGWRIGWKNETTDYPGLIGGEDWAIELTETEFSEFCRIFEQLAITMTSMKEELMEEEKIACEVESELLWLEVEGFPHAYSLRVILNQGRRCEGNWPAEVVKELYQEIQKLNTF